MHNSCNACYVLFSAVELILVTILNAINTSEIG